MNPPASPGVIVVLEEMEMLTAGLLGVVRQIAALKAGRRDRHGIDAEDAFKAHVAGAMGELAVAKCLGLYFPLSVNTFKTGADVGACFQVRTRSREDYELIVRKDDRDDDRFVLVVGTPPKLRVCGWITGGEAKQDVWLANHGDRGACWFVPQVELRPITDLLAADRREAA